MRFKRQFEDESFNYESDYVDVVLSSGRKVCVAFLSEGYETVTYYSEATYENPDEKETKVVCTDYSWKLYFEGNDEEVDYDKVLIEKYKFTEQEVEELNWLSYKYSDYFKDVDENFKYKPKIKDFNFYKDYYKNLNLKLTLA